MRSGLGKTYDLIVVGESKKLEKLLTEKPKISRFTLNRDQRIRHIIQDREDNGEELTADDVDQIVRDAEAE